MVDNRSFKDFFPGPQPEGDPDPEAVEGGATGSLDITKELDNTPPQAGQESLPPLGGVGEAYKPPEPTGGNVDEKA